MSGFILHFRMCHFLLVISLPQALCLTCCPSFQSEVTNLLKIPHCASSHSSLFTDILKGRLIHCVCSFFSCSLSLIDNLYLYFKALQRLGFLSQHFASAALCSAECLWKSAMRFSTTPECLQYKGIHFTMPRILMRQKRNMIKCSGFVHHSRKY